jgi:hypothetical protein
VLQHLAESGPPISELDLRRFEREANLELPLDYRAFVLKHNGGRPSSAEFTLLLDNEPLRWRLHFFFGLNDPEQSCCLCWNYEITRATRPPGTLPIASDEGGNMFYLRWAEPKRGSIYFGATPSDGQIVRLAHISNSFSAFLEQLGEVTE